MESNMIIVQATSLPLPIRQKIHTPTVSVQEQGDAVILMPIRKGSGLRGIAVNSAFTTEKLLAYKHEDKRLDNE
jgi:hypothetical protein